MKTLQFLITIAAALLVMASCGAPDRRTADDSIDQAMGVNDTTAAVNEDDAEFAVKAADAGLGEIALGRLAMEQATDSRLKKFAQRMVSEHETINDELLTIAAQHNITLPPVGSEDQVDKQRDLRDKSGAEFDREYIEQLVDDHDDIVSLYEDASKDVRNPDLQAFASRTLSVLKKHEMEAQSLRDSISPPDTLATPRRIMP